MEGPIIPICKRLATTAILAALPLSPTLASRNVIPETIKHSTYVEARAADALGDEARAAKLFAGLAIADPADRSVARRAVASAIDAGEIELALSVARAMPADAMGIDTRLLLTADALRRGKGGEALALVEGKDHGNGGFVAPLIRAWMEQAAGQDGAARLLGIGSDTLLGPFAVEQRAALLLAHRRTEEALALIPKALEGAGGRDTRLRLAFAAMLARLGERDKARALLTGDDPVLARLDVGRPQAGIAIDSAAAAFAELLAGLAVTLAQGNDRAFPLALVQIARHAAPDHSEATILAGLLLDRQGREAAALAAFDRVPANDPFVGDALDGASNVLIEAGRATEALDRALRLARAKSASAADHGRLGDVFDELDRHQEAAEAYRAAAELAARDKASNRWTWHLLRAAQLEEIDRWPEARAELRAALTITPDQPLLLNYLGYGSLERGENLDEAEAMIRRALEQRPGDSSITDSLGWALYKRGRLPEAIVALRKAAASDDAEAEIHEHLGDALFRAGRRHEARFSWRAALLTAADEQEARIKAKIDSGWTEATAAP